MVSNLSILSRCERSPKKRPPNVHPVPDTGTGKGVPHKPLPDAKETHRDGARPLPNGTPDQNMVPEPTDEAEEGDPGDQGAERAGEAGPGPEGGRRRGGGGGPGGPELVAPERLNADSDVSG